MNLSNRSTAPAIRYNVRYYFTTLALIASLALPCASAAPADSGANSADQAAIAAALQKAYATLTKDADGNVIAVDLSTAELAGGQLQQLHNLPKLATLVIVGSSFADRDVPAICGLKQLRQLTLENTDLTNAGLLALDDLPALRTLNIRRNSALTDKALAKLPDRFPQLQSLLLLFNNFTDGALDSVAQLSDLRSLDLRGCVKISNAGIQKLLPLKNLEELKFGPSQANDEVAKTLAQFTKLKTLMVEDTHLTDAGLPLLVHLTDLEELSLLRTRVSDDGLVALENLIKLGRLDLRDTLVRGPGLVHLKKLSGLRVLSLSESPVGDLGMQVLEALPNLERLELFGTGISDVALAHFSGLSKLNWLNLQDTNITDDGIKHLTGLKNLATLNLSGTQITDAGLRALANLPKLKSLNVEFTGATDAGVAKLRKALPELKVTH